MIAPFKLPDNGIPIKVGDRSYIYKNVFHPIEWFSGEPFRPRVETLVINKTGTEIFLRIKEDKSGYRIPGGSIDEDSTYEKQAENETNEEALISIVDLKATNITYTELFKKDFIKNGGDSPISYAGFITYVYMATYGGKVDKSTIEEKDLDDDMAENGKFYPIASVIDLLSKPHIEALSKSDKIAINLRWIINKRLDNLNIGDEKKPIFEMGNNLELRGENSYIYHGSMHKIDSFKPMSLDLGNGLQEPGWSTFCFRNYTWAKRFALMRLIQKYFDGEKEKNELKKCGWDMFSNRPYIHKSVFEELCNNLKNQCFYVYTINAENLELGLGNDLRFPEVTFRESGVVPEKRDCIYASEDVLRTELMILTDIEPDRFEKLMLSKVEELNRGWISCMINRNYVADSEVGKLTKAVSEGKLKPGDDVKKYIEANGIVLKDVSFVERLTELDNTDDIKKKESNVSESFDVSEEYEETIILGDSRALFTSTEYDVCSEDKTDEKDTLFPSDDDIPQDAKLQYKRFLYNIHESGQLFLMAKSDFTTFESKNGIFGILRVFVRPMYRMKKLGSILVEDVLRFVKTITPMTILVEVSDGISSSSGIKNWIMSYGFSIMTRTDKTVGFKLDTSILESYINLSNFSYYHAMFPKPGYKAEWAYGWDEEQYYKDIESAIIAEMKHQKDAKGKDLYSEEKFTLNMYTMGDECSSIYLGKITVYNMEKGGINWEWEEQEDLDPSMVSYIKEEVQKKPPVDLSDIPLPDDVVVTNEGNCYCESDVTRFKENFKKKGSLQLSAFKRIKADKATISRYKNSLKLLNYSDIDRDVCVGYIWIDGNDDVVGACAVEYGVLEKFNWITVIEVTTKYQGYGIGRQLLDHAVKSLKGNTISVWEHNPVALQMYEKYGFKISKLSLRDVKSKKSCMYFMYLPTALSQSDINSANETTIGQAKESLDYDIVDLSDIPLPDNMMIEESLKDSKLLEPVFIVLTFTGTTFGKLITKFQNCKFSHAGLALNSKLNQIFTFNIRTEKEQVEKRGKIVTKDKIAGGAFVESIDKYSNKADGGDADVCVLCIFVEPSVKQTIKNNIEKIFSNVEKTGYNIGNVFNIVINRAVDTSNSMKMICSQFVDRMLKMVNVDITGNRSSNLVSPNDFAKSSKTNSHVFILFDGKKSGYSSKEVDKKVNYIRNSGQYQNINAVVESTIEYIEENVIFNKDNTAYNVDKFESGESNMLFVTGLSGSGKSTLAKKIATEYNAEWIELDNFEQCYGFTDSQLKEAGEVFYEYLSNHKSLWEKLKAKEITGKELGKEIEKFVHYCISWCRERKDKKFVIEGVQIYAFLDSSTLKSQPVIIMGTSAKNSILQRFRRNGDGKIEWGKEIKNEFPNLLAWYWGEEKNLKSFRKDMKTGAVVETVIVVEAEGDEDLPSLGKDDKTEDYSVDAEKSVDDEQQNTDDQNDEPKNDDTSEDGEGETENPDDLDNELGGSDYTEDAENSDSGDMEDSSSGEPMDTDNSQENKSQSNNNTIKNYSILRDFESLYRLANEISDTLDPILMEKPIQNKVLTQVRENLSAIKKAITDFITLHFKASDYAFNLYYYEVFLGAVKKNVEILAKNKLLSTDNSKKKKPERK